MGTFYVVATPIGNLRDITLRALDALGEAAVIYAEDTRHSRGLLRHHGIETKLRSLHEHNERARSAEVLRALAEDQILALISDAGTPLVSDPGSRLLERIVEEGHVVVPIPGASAVLAALVGSGFPVGPFTFFGFLPRKGKERERLLERVRTSEETVVLFESPERLVRLLTALSDRLGEGRRVTVARELTKLHEEFVRGTTSELLGYYQEVRPRGEITVVIEARADEGPEDVDEDEAARLARSLLSEGLGSKDAVAELMRRTGLPRNRAYRIVHTLS